MAERPPLTPELRRRLGLPARAPRPYPWGLAVLLVAVSVGPVWLAGYHLGALAVVAVGLVVLPAMRWTEQREQAERERLYTHGCEGRAVVVEVEPAGDQRNDHLVRLEIFANGEKVATMVSGCPLARKGLGPGDEVRVAYDERDPRRCLIIDREKRGVIVDAVFDD